MSGARPVWAVVLAFGEYDYTRECLRALLALDPPADRVLLVDNGSPDGTPDRARAEFPQVEVLPLGENRWFAGGVNAGLARALDAGAASVLLVNNDLVLERGALGAMAAALEADTRRGAVSPKLFTFEPPDRIWFAGGIVSRGFALIRHRGLGKKDDALIGSGDGPRPVDYVSGAAALLSRSALERTGLLDESYVIYVEDVDWSARARKAGFVLWYEPAARGWHHVSVTSGGGLTPLKAYFRLRSGALYLSRHAAVWERPLAWLAYGAWTAVLLVRALVAGDRASAGALLLGFRDFTAILMGGTPRARTPLAFARPAPPR
ncbi:MAG TPA: glycosyltransferase family 2 protein [Candidatus Omnitrophota bacterium]|nr:glycosyltransferase family 2 protein [Candidatus Omnitrophota bacterium]